MSESYEQTWETYASSWKADSEADKRALFEKCLSRACRYTDPLAETSGWDELVAYMAEFHRQIPGGHFRTTYFLAHHGKSIAKWTMHDGGGKMLGDGVSYGEYDDAGKLVAMSGFFEANEA